MSTPHKTRLFPLGRAFLAMALLVSSHLPAQAASDDALVEVVMVSDLQCPFCSRAHTTINQLREEYGGKVTFRWLNQPLAFHQRAKPAAIAAEAAKNQGKLDTFVDRVFAEQNALEDADLERYAREVGLDMAKFAADIKDPATAQRVERDALIANAVGATGTPTFFINGRNLRGAQPIEKFRELIDDELARPVTGSPSAHRMARLKAENGPLFDYLYDNKTPTPTTSPTEKADTTVYKVTLDKDDPVLGEPLAPVTLVLFGNYQCPFTRKHESTVDALREKYGKDLRVVFKHSPLPFHKSAVPAARAAICANAQKKFEGMHNALMAAQFVEGEETTLVMSLARELKLNLKKFESCLNDPKTQAKIDRDLALAASVTARGTPNSYINGIKVTGAKSIESFTTVIDDQLAIARGKLAEGVKTKALYAGLIAEGKVFEPLDQVVQAIDQAGAARLGPADAPIQIAVFSDLQCPFCSRHFSSLEEAVNKFSGKVSVTFHHFPLSFHRSARPAAEYTTCAQEQGKFWQFTAEVFANQETLPDSLDAAADTVGLDGKALKSCLESGRAAALVDRQMADATRIGIRGTPTVYIQGRKWESTNGYGIDALEATLKQYFPDIVR